MDSEKISRLGVVYASSDAYAMQTMTSLTSVLDNNSMAQAEKRVELDVYVYTDQWSDQSVQNLMKIGEQYHVAIEVRRPEEVVDKLKEIGIEPYRGSYMMDAKIIIPLEIETEYNLLFLESDIVMNRGETLYDLACYQFEEGKKSCASVIDMQSSRMIKEVVGLDEKHHVFNTGVFLVNPILYRKHDTVGQIVRAIEEKGMLLPYKDVLRNAYGFRNEISVLPMKYEVYPGQKMIKVDQWMRIFGLDYKEYYSRAEIDAALEKPCFIHYIDFIVSKPWLRDEFEKKGMWPYIDVWEFYQDKTVYRNIDKAEWDRTNKEKVKRFVFKYFRMLWIEMCTISYKRDVKRRNTMIANEVGRSKNDKEF